MVSNVTQAWYSENALPTGIRETLEVLIGTSVPLIMTHRWHTLIWLCVTVYLQELLRTQDGEMVVLGTLIETELRMSKNPTRSLPVPYQVSVLVFSFLAACLIKPWSWILKVSLFIFYEITNSHKCGTDYPVPFKRSQALAHYPWL